MMKNLMRLLSAPARLTAITLVVCGLFYPLLLTGIAQVALPYRANGSILVGGKDQAYGSELIGQSFTSPGFFHPRPSAHDYDAMASGGSNLGPSSRRLYESLRRRAAKVRRQYGTRRVPVDMVTASSSGLDPDISLLAAYVQVVRVSKRTGISEDKLRRLIAAHTIPRQFGFLGEPRVNVLSLNMEVAKTLGKPQTRQ